MLVLTTVWVLGFSRETEPIGYVCVRVVLSVYGRVGGFYFKELAHRIVEAGKSKIYTLADEDLGEEL